MKSDNDPFSSASSAVWSLTTSEETKLQVKKLGRREFASRTAKVYDSFLRGL